MYYKFIAWLQYTCQNYEIANYNFIGLESVLCIVLKIIDVGKDV